MFRDYFHIGKFWLATVALVCLGTAGIAGVGAQPPAVTGDTVVPTGGVVVKVDPPGPAPVPAISGAPTIALGRQLILTASGSGDSLVWDVSPDTADIFTTPDGKTTVFSSPAPGKFSIVLYAAQNGVGAKAKKSVTVTGVAPAPGPDPGPSPAPAPVATSLILITVEKAAERTAGAGQLLGDKAFWKSLTDAGHDVREVEGGPTNPESAVFQKAITQGGGMPILIIADRTTKKQLDVVKLPTSGTPAENKAAVQALVDQYTGKAKK